MSKHEAQELVAFSADRQQLYLSGVNAKLTPRSTDEERVQARRSNGARCEGIALKELEESETKRSKASLDLRHERLDLLRARAEDQAEPPAPVLPEGSTLLGSVRIAAGCVLSLGDFVLAWTAVAALMGLAPDDPKALGVALCFLLAPLLLELLFDRRLYSGKPNAWRGGAIFAIELTGGLLALVVVGLAALSRQPLIDMLASATGSAAANPEIDTSILGVLVTVLAVYVVIAATLLLVHGQHDVRAAIVRRAVARAAARRARKLMTQRASVHEANGELALANLEHEQKSGQVACHFEDMHAQTEGERIRATTERPEPPPPSFPEPKTADEKIERLRAARRARNAAAVA